MFVADASAPVLIGDDRHHLTRVLRLRDGDPMTVGDGAGRWGRAVFRSDAEPESTADVVVVPEAEPTVAVGFALIKGGRPELVVQKLPPDGGPRPDGAAGRDGGHRRRNATYGDPRRTGLATLLPRSVSLADRRI